jgi:hypothetical protein
MGLFDFVEEIAEDIAVADAFDSGYRRGAGLGIDVRDGDLVENFGDGLGIDLETGQLEVEIGNSGLDF